MPKKFVPPFNLDADFYDKDKQELEWCYWWGECPEATKVIWRVEDVEGNTLSSHNTRE